MNWKRIPKENTDIPSKGKYSDWKDILADEGFNHCVYCTIKEGSFGRRNFHVEHYKPKGLEIFKHLENDFQNLFFACCICNCFKGDFWLDPQADHSISAFPDPSTVDYSELFELSSDATLNGKNIAGKFIIEKLYLNRPQLILERRLNVQIEKMKESFGTFKASKNQLYELALSGNKDATAFLIKITEINEKLNKNQIAIRESIPYTSKDVSKP